MEKEAQWPQRPHSLFLAENFKLNTDNFYRTLPLEGGNPRAGSGFGFPDSAQFLN